MHNKCKNCLLEDDCELDEPICSCCKNFEEVFVDGRFWGRCIPTNGSPFSGQYVCGRFICSNLEII